MSLGHIIGAIASVGVLFANTSAFTQQTASAKADSLTLHSVAFDFPTSDSEFAPGAGAELVTNNCTACHSAGMILTQPALTKATWLGEVNKMRSTYKAPVADEDVEPIATYLARLQAAP